jgi:predicted dithiol-disulfide oxidoreductase (DUF899 family)
MTASTTPHPPIVSRDQWLAERKRLLADEKELTKQLDRVNAEELSLNLGDGLAGQAAAVMG